MFTPPRLSWKPNIISLEESAIMAFIVAGNDKTFLGLLAILKKFAYRRQIFIKILSIKFHGHPRWYMHTDGQMARRPELDSLMMAQMDSETPKNEE